MAGKLNVKKNQIINDTHKTCAKTWKDLSDELGYNLD